MLEGAQPGAKDRKLSACPSGRGRADQGETAGVYDHARTRSGLIHGEDAGRDGSDRYRPDSTGQRSAPDGDSRLANRRIERYLRVDLRTGDIKQRHGNSVEQDTRPV